MYDDDLAEMTQICRIAELISSHVTDGCYEILTSTEMIEY